MAKHSRKKNTYIPIKLISFFLVLIIGVVVYFVENPQASVKDFFFHFKLENALPKEKRKATTKQIQSGTLTIDYIDVGQADCALIYDGENVMLVDGGNNADGPLVADYIKNVIGMTHIDTIVCTHAHEDHCGGLDTIIEELDVDQIMLPLTATDTETYKEVEEAVRDYTLSVLAPKVGDEYELGQAVWTILCCDTAPQEDLNLSSIVFRLDYGENSFLFTGDAGAANEQEMLDGEIELSCDVLKAGHHGSLSGNTTAWLNGVQPKDIIISVGVDNEYTLPDTAVLDRFEKIGANIYRTDLQGTIEITSDGHDYTVTIIGDTYTDAA